MAVYELLFNLTTFTIIVSFITAYLALEYWRMLYFVRKGIPSPFPVPLFGTMFTHAKGLTYEFLDTKRKYGDVYGMYFGRRILVVHDLDIIQEVMISRFSSFPNRTGLPFKDKPFDDAVTNKRDEHWREVRGRVSPAFTGNKMKQMTTLINVCCDRMVRNFELQREAAGAIQCKDVFGRYSLEVVASVFFGLDIDSQNNPDDPFIKHSQEVFRTAFSSAKYYLPFLIPGLGKLYDFFGVSVTDFEAKKFFQDTISKVLDLRENGEVERMDMLQLLAESHKREANPTDSGKTTKRGALPLDEIMANAVTFFLAGYETTNTALCFTAYLLATNPEMQERLLEEVNRLAPKKEDVTYEVLSGMEYLDCFIRESLRFYPPVAVLDRHCDKGDIVVKDFTIPNMTQILVPIFTIHHDPEVWDDPEEFRPERFNKENKGKIRPVSWLPFGDGPRNCLGMRLALMEIKFAITRLLQDYRIETCSETEIPPVLNNTSPFICPSNGIKLSIFAREQSTANSHSE